MALVFKNNELSMQLDSLIIDASTSEKIFKRTGEITLLKVRIHKSILK